MAVVNNYLQKVEGEVARITDAEQIEAFFNSDATEIKFGRVVIKDPATSGGGKNPSTGNDVVAGISVRELRQGDVTGFASVAVHSMGSVMRMGYITIKLTDGVAVDGAPVYYRYALGATGTTIRAVGTFEAAAIANEVIQLVGATFNGVVDAQGLVEIRISL